MYKILFKDSYNHFYNLGIILLMLNNFRDKIINFVYIFVDLLGKKGKRNAIF